MKSKNKTTFPPLVFNVFKPARMSSYDVVRHFKRHLPQGFGKIGHFGTLDPFASGVLMIGIAGAARLNDFIHDSLPKTYLAVGKLGIETPTGDYTSEIIQRDETPYLSQKIGRLPLSFLNERWREKFVGPYLQAPHKYSATKFQGRNLHEWAREGIEIKKEPVQRQIYSLEVVKYSFPYVAIRATVSSGTYIRTLFTDLSQDLGTIGSLISLVRESVGGINFKSAIHKEHWPHERDMTIIEKGIQISEVLPFSKIFLNEHQQLAFKNGAFLKQREFEIKETDNYFWMTSMENGLIGLGQRMDDGFIRPKINFHKED
jgi:tRNA pseudouridine55 synthase